MERARIAEVEQVCDRGDRGAARFDMRDRDLATHLVDELAKRGLLVPQFALQRATTDGKVVVGFMWNGCVPVAFRWVDGVLTPLQVLGASSNPGGKPTNRATVVSDDGLVAAGFAENLMLDRSPAIWAANGSGQLIDATDQTGPGEVLSINADGSHVAGIWANDGFTWTSAGGRVAIPRLDSSLPTDPVYPNAMSGDGSLVFGGIGDAFFSLPFAFVWSEGAARRSNRARATSRGWRATRDSRSRATRSSRVFLVRAPMAPC